MEPTPDEMIAAHRDWMVAGGLSPATVESAVELLHRAHRELPAGLHQAFPEELAQWLATPGWSAQTRATYRQHLRRFYAWATDPADPWISYDPSTGLRRPRIPRRLPKPATDEQVRIAVHQTSMPWRLHCRLAAYQGLRCIEISRLRREHISAQSTRVWGKGDAYRDVPTHPLVWEIVEPLPRGPVAYRPDGGPVTAAWVSQSTRAHLHRRGVPISMHWLRHWYATVIQREYRDQRVTQTLLGHVSPASTAGYTLVAERSLREAVACLPDLSALPATA